LADERHVVHKRRGRQPTLYGQISREVLFGAPARAQRDRCNVSTDALFAQYRNQSTQRRTMTSTRLCSWSLSLTMRIDHGRRECIDAHPPGVQPTTQVHHVQDLRPN
jgi:hypothetical protein